MGSGIATRTPPLGGVPTSRSGPGGRPLTGPGARRQQGAPPSTSSSTTGGPRTGFGSTTPTRGQSGASATPPPATPPETAQVMALSPSMTRDSPGHQRSGPATTSGGAASSAPAPASSAASAGAGTGSGTRPGPGTASGPRAVQADDMVIDDVEDFDADFDWE